MEIIGKGALAGLAALSLLTTPAFADDGELLRKSMSSAAGSVEFPVPEAEHAFIDYMKFYVPAQASSGALTPIDYYDVDGNLVKTEEVARPLVGVYIYGPVSGVEGTGFVGHGRRDAYAAISLDDGNTWKRTNLSESADKSSFTVSIPFPDPAIPSGEDLIEFDPDGVQIEDATLREIGPFDLLFIDGDVAPRFSVVEVRNAVTQEIIARTRVIRRDGEWFRIALLRDEVPCLIQAGVDGVFGPAIEVEGAPEDCAGSAGPTMITEYPGDVINIFHAVAGNRVIVAWPSRFCQTGTPGYTVDAGTVGGYLGIDNAADLYLTDLFGVAGSQGSVDYSEDEFEQNQPVGEVPYSCLWTARGVLRPDPDDPETTEVVWFKAERLTSGRRDVNRVEVRMVEGAGAAITWQEDPDGLRPGQGEGPGEGWSGAIAHNQTDIWYSFLPWDEFDTVDDNGTGVPLDLYAGDTKPKAYVPFAIPMRLSNNAKCSYPLAQESDEYCDVAVAGAYGLKDQCADQVDIPLGPQGTLQPICVNEDGLPNVANTASTRPRLSLQARDTDGDGETDSAWVVVVAEEDKGFGRYFFQNDEEYTEGGTATPCTDETADNCETADIGKNVWYYSFDMGHPATSADTSDTGLVANLVSQGNMLNQAESNWRTGGLYLPMDTADMWDFSNGGADYNFLIYRTEIARRGSLLVQSVAKAAASTSGLTAMPAWKQGLMNQGGPADVMVRRITNAGASDNPYDFANIACATWQVEPGTNPYYPKGLCADPAINLSGTTPYVCEQGSQSTNPDCPTIDADGIASIDPEDQQVFNDEISWFQCPGSPYCGTTPESTALGSNLDDQSWYNPLDVAKGHRGFLDGDFVMMLYAWSPNWKKNAVGHDRYELYIRRSFDGGVTWTTTPGSLGGAGTVTCETWRAPSGTTEEPHECTSYAAGADEQARNVSQLKSMQFTILDPRYAPTGGPTATSVLDENGLPTIEPTDVRDASRYFVVYETGDNTTVTDGEAEPLDLNYGRAILYGDHYQVWAEETDLSVCYPSDPHGVDVPAELVGSGFCNEFDDLEGRRDVQSSEASLAATPAGDFLYGVWAQWSHDADTGELTEADAMARRVWYLDDYISTDNAWTLPGTSGGSSTP